MTCTKPLLQAQGVRVLSQASFSSVRPNAVRAEPSIAPKAIIVREWKRRLARPSYPAAAELF